MQEHASQLVSGVPPGDANIALQQMNTGAPITAFELFQRAGIADLGTSIPQQASSSTMLGPSISQSPQSGYVQWLQSLGLNTGTAAQS